MTEPSSAPAPASAGSARWLKIALVISLVVNVILIGFAAGFALKHHRGMGRFHLPLHQMTEGMSPPSRELVESIMDKHRPVIRASMREMHRERRHLEGLMAAETFDRAAADASFARLKQLSVDVQDELHQALIEAATQLPAEDRQKLRLRDWRHKHGHRQLHEATKPSQ